MWYIIGYLISGALMVALGFCVALQKDPFLGLVGFLSFFVVGVTLIVEGLKRRGKNRGS